MPIESININFGEGVDTKTDSKQVSIGKFLSMQNSVFTTAKRLTKRDGNQLLLSGTNATYLTTLNDNLTAIGNAAYAENTSNGTWITKGVYAPTEVETLSLIRNSINQTQADSAIAANGLACITYTETNGSTTSYKYAVINSKTGQNVVAPTSIPAASGAVTGSARVFLLGNYFVIVFTNVISATSHLQYIAISTSNPTSVTAAADIASSYVSSTRLSWDAVVSGSNLYVAYNTTTGGQAIKVTYLASTAAAAGSAPASPVTLSGYTATIMSVCADTTSASGLVYFSWYNSGTSTGYTAGISTAPNFTLSMGPVETITTGTIANLSSAAQGGTCQLFYEVTNAYSYDSSIPTNYIKSVSVTSGGSLSATATVVRSVGLASKAFIVNGVIYFLAAYQSSAASGAGYQPTYFLINGSTSTQASPAVVAKLAYSNGGGYLATGIPNVTVTGNVAQVTYLYKDLLESQAPAAQQSIGLVAPAFYTQTGINLASFTIGTEKIGSIEIAESLQLTGGFGWLYDGYLPVEENFFLWPDSIEATWSATGGSIVAQPDGTTNTNAYFYQVVYEWTDNQGNIYRSAPSIPVAVTTTSTGTTGSITVHIPTLRLTYKIANPVKITVYRWSVANQVYYQTTSISTPLLNDTTLDAVTLVDTNADASIVGNEIIYTTGGVVENVNSPASNLITSFDTRVWKVSAEDPNLLWYSKQVIENVPVEWSDLLTYYVAPNIGTSISTGGVTAFAPMDDKLILFKGKGNVICFINGAGPDNAGSNSQYPASPWSVTSPVSCTNQASLVLTPSGLMFQSDKGIWLLDRNLQCTYIGEAVEKYNSSTVTSAVSVPGTTEVRFTLNTGEVLVYDYFFGQWDTFDGMTAISSTIQNNLHTYLNKHGEVYQQNPGSYLDGTNPVLMQFETGPINIAGISGFQRAIDLVLTGSYESPHKLLVQIAFDFGQHTQSYTITPDNATPVYGGDSLYGQTSPFGGPGKLLQWRIPLEMQTCQSFQISLQEYFDPSVGQVAGAGFTLSNINCEILRKAGRRPIDASRTQG